MNHDEVREILFRALDGCDTSIESEIYAVRTALSAADYVIVRREEVEEMVTVPRKIASDAFVAIGYAMVVSSEPSLRAGFEKLALDLGEYIKPRETPASGKAGAE